MNKFKMLLKSQMPLVMVMVVAIGAMLGAGCEKQKIDSPQETSQVAQQNPQQQQQSDTRLLPLENTSWKFVAFVENGETTRVNDDCPSGDCYSLNFENNEEWRGTSSSNDMFGTYTVDGSLIQIQISITTEVGETENGYKYVDKLVRTTSYDSDSVQLNLYINKSEYLLFERVQL